MIYLYVFLGINIHICIHISKKYLKISNNISGLTKPNKIRPQTPYQSMKEKFSYFHRL